MDNSDLFYTLRALAGGTSGKGNLNDAMNPRKVVYINIPDAKNGKSGIGTTDNIFYDPYGNAYRIAIDADYDNQILNSVPNYLDLTNNIRTGVIAWSYGKDGKFGSKTTPSPNGDGKYKSSDDVLSWQ